MQKGLKLWVKCYYFEALHIEMHVHTSDLNTGSLYDEQADVWCLSWEVY